MKKPFCWIGFLLTMMLVSGCTRTLSAPTTQPTAVLPVSTSVPLVVMVPTPLSTEAPTLSPSLEPTVSPTAGPFVPFEATAMVNALKVRTNPGYLFPALGVLPENTALTVLGRAPGGEWIYIQTPDGAKGWVFAQLLVTDRDLKTAPIVEPDGVQEIRGKVSDASGNPISGVQYAITQNGDASLRNDAMTDETGEFIAFMPLTANGTWNVGYVAIACTSNTMDAKCNCKGGRCATSDPQAQTVTLPQQKPLEFIWK